MPYTFTAAPSSRVTKPRMKNPLLKRTSSSPSSMLPRRKPLQRAQSKPENGEREDEPCRLDNLGIVTSLAGISTPSNSVQIINHIKARIYDDIPERGGMNSTRIAEVLNFRRNLPSVTTSAHMHALSNSSTTMEREIASLMIKGVLRKVIIPGRGIGGSSIGEVLVLVEDWVLLIKEARLESQIKGTFSLPEGNSISDKSLDKYIEYLNASPLASVIPKAFFTASEATALMQAGFLTSLSPYTNSTNIFTRPYNASSSTLTSIAYISKAASGSEAAIGGEGAVHGVGGGGPAGLRVDDFKRELSLEDPGQPIIKGGGDFQLSLPNIGSFLKLLTSARSHLMFLLSKSKYNEAPLYLLRERWDGGVAADDPAAKSMNLKGQFLGVLPGRTRKWKQFYGLKFDWVLAECFGAGLVEVFETRSVGRSVRAV
ncbi:MAG: hypothetical protein Q9187_002114 [Circinaria calcarea]